MVINIIQSFIFILNHSVLARLPSMVYYFDFFFLSCSYHNMQQSESINDNRVNMNQAQNTTTRIKHITSRLFAFICGNNLKSSRRRFWFILLCFAISSYIMCIANVLTEYRWKENPKIILPDLVFDFADKFTPSITHWIKYPDLSVNISMIITFLWLLFDGPHKQKIAVTRRYLTMQSILELGRSVCVLATQLPTPFHTIKDPMYAETWNQNIFYEALLVLFRIKATSNDVFYSGHTVVITLCAVCVETYSKRKWLIVLFWTYSIFSLYVIIATKFHYTIDVLIAFVLSVIVWKFYHMTMAIKRMRDHLPIFKYFESDKEAMAFVSNSSLLSASIYNLNNSNAKHKVTEVSPADEIAFNRTETATKSISELP